MKISWIQMEDTIILSQLTMDALSIQGGHITLKIGMWSHAFNVKTDNNADDNLIGLPEWISKLFTLPTHLDFDVKLKEGRTLMIGPVIGMVTSKKLMSPKGLRRFTSRLKNYEEINGIMFIFCGAGVDEEKQLIKGYYYNPQNKKSSCWVEGTFPFPDALYKRQVVRKSVYRSLEKTIGKERIFNSFHPSKWDTWNLLPEDSNSKNLLPHTEQLTSIMQTQRLLKKYGKLYLKPARGSQGIGIQCIQKVDSTYQLIHHFNQVSSYSSLELLWEQIKPLTEKNYIVQQSIDAGLKNRHADFRAYMQKNKQKDWICQLTIARFSKEQEIATNLKFLDHLTLGQEGIKKIFNVNEEEAERIEKNMIQSCIEFCQSLDVYGGHFGDMAVDLMVDQHKKVWILEVNTKNYGFASFKRIKNIEAFYRCKTTPLQYAKALAGF